MFNKRLVTCAFLFLAGCIVAPSKAPNFILSTASPMRYIATESAEIINNQTLSFKAILLRAGPQLKLVLSNEYGNTPVRIGAMTIRYSNSMSIVKFGGKSEFEIPAKGTIETDALQINASNGQAIETRIFLKGENRLSSFHGDGAKPSRISQYGDFTQSETLDSQKRINIRPFFAGFKVLGEDQTPAIVTFGDSITDAECSIEQYPCNYSQVLFSRLSGANKDYTVLNMGISGNQIIKDFYGVSAQKRFERDVLGVPNLKYVIILIGINDIGLSGPNNNCPDCALIDDVKITSALSDFSQKARAKGAKVFISPLLPFEGANYYSPEKEKIRQKVNDWIRASNEFSHEIDFEGIIADPVNKSKMRVEFDRGDRLHPNLNGQKALGNAIDLEIFE